MGRRESNAKSLCALAAHIFVIGGASDTVLPISRATQCTDTVESSPVQFYYETNDMIQAGAYGQRLGEFLHLKDEPPLLVTRAMSGAEIAVTETRDDNPVSRLSGTLKSEDAYLISLKLRDYPDCELWERGTYTMKADVRAGATYLYDLRRDPRYLINKPFHSISFIYRVLHSTALLSNLARRASAACPAQREFCYDDAVIRHISASLCQGMRRPDEVNQLFIDHMMLALTAHVARVYGNLPLGTERIRGSLAPWQMKRACERIETTVGGKLSLVQIAAEFGLSASHFARAFKISTGLPPHQWLLHQRVNAAKQLMTVHEFPLSRKLRYHRDLQTKVTSHGSFLPGRVSLAAWRREMRRT